MIGVVLLVSQALAGEVMVRERADGDPIEGATVTAGGRTATTDHRGVAEIDLTGVASVEVGAPEYAPATVEVSGDDPLRVWLLSRPSSYEVVIEALRPTPHPARHALDAEQAYETPGVHEDAARLVQSLPGVAVQREYGPSAGALQVRGSAPRDSRIYLDGIEVPYLYHYNQYASVFPASQLDSLELFPSAFGAAYGDAIGAVVEARSTVDRPETVHGSANVSFVMAGGDVRAPIAGGKGWVSVAGRRSYFDVAGERSAQYPRWPRFYDFSTRAELGDARKGTGLFFWGAGDGYTRAAGELDVLDPVEAAETPSLDYGRRFEVYGGRHHWDGDTSGRMVLAAVHYRNEAALSEGGSEALDDLTVTSRLDVSGTAAEGLAWEAGWEVRGGRTALEVVTGDGDAVLVAEEAPSLARGAAVDDRLLRARLAGYGGLAWSPGDLRIMPGLRLGVDSGGPREEGGRAVVLPEPRLAVRWQPTSRTALKVGGGSYLQRPDSELLLPGTGDPSLPTTRALQVAGGVEHAVGGRLELALDVWRKWIDQPLVLPVDAPPYPADGADGAGIELVTRYRLRERFFLWGWLALSRTRVHEGDRSFAASGDQPVSGGIVASLDLNRWNLGLRYRYGSGLPWTPVSGSLYDAGRDTWEPVPGAPNSARYPAYQKVDVRVAHTWALRGWELMASLEVWYVPPLSAQLFPVWSYDFREQGWVVGPTVLPLASLRARF